MRNVDINELEEHYLREKLDGMDYSEIRKELRMKRMPEEDIAILIRCIDNKVLEGYRPASDGPVINGALILGIVLFVGGTVVTIGTYQGWIDLKGYRLFAYGPILGGLGLMVSSKQGRATLFDRRGGIRRR